MTPNRASELAKPFLAIFIFLFIASFLYSAIYREDDDNDFTVTVTYDCNVVLANQPDYPAMVINTCERIRIDSR
jgi:hypothetical protein